MYQCMSHCKIDVLPVEKKSMIMYSAVGMYYMHVIGMSYIHLERIVVEEGVKNKSKIIK